MTTVPGIRNALFGGDGLLRAAPTGPGRIWLQSMSLPTWRTPSRPTRPVRAEAGIGGLLTGG